jgi:hypothetical protein
VNFKNVLTVFASLTGALILSEFTLNKLGYKPHFYTNYRYFTPKDSLIVYKNFSNDSLGIYHFSELVYDSQKFYSNKGALPPESITGQLHPIDNTWNVYEDFRIVRSGIRSNFCNASELCSALKKIEVGAISSTDTFWKQQLKLYSKEPFNTHGFRSIPFLRSEKKNTPKVMIVGDSFVYGVSCNPITNSFADILLARGYLVYNFGIPGTDPAQYLAIIEQYLPILKPDILVVCFFPANDLMYFTRKVEKSQPIEYLTNAGIFFSNICGKFYPPDSAFIYYKNLLSIPQNNMFNKFCGQTAIGALLWGTLYKFGVVTHKERDSYEQCHGQLVGAITNTKKYIDAWKRICSKENVLLIDAVLPVVQENKPFYNEDLLDKLFESKYYHLPTSSISVKEHFPTNDQHFNSLGNKLFADYLDGIIKSSLYQKQRP